MSRSQADKSQSQLGSASTQVAGPSFVKTTFGVVIVLILTGIGWMIWQTHLAPAQPHSSADVTKMPIASQSQEGDDTAAVSPQTVLLPAPRSGSAHITVPPIALADIPGNVATGQPAPDFTVRTMGDGTFALEDHIGQPTLILFMASWCTPCIYEAQNLNQVYTQYKDRGLNIMTHLERNGSTC